MAHLLKRVVGLPGDRVRVHDGTLEYRPLPCPLRQTGDDSRDGRFFGLVDRDAILDHVEGVLFRHGQPTWIGL